MNIQVSNELPNKTVESKISISSPVVTPRFADNKMPDLQASLSFPVEASPYDTVYVDLTYKCNMACKFCYNPVRQLPDMDLAYFEEVCEKLPRTTLFRFLGGEPTLHPQFFDFVKTAQKHRHFSSVITNGLKFVDYEYAEEVKSLGIPLVIGMTMDGGKSRNDYYREIVNADCAAQKMQALDNMSKAGFKRVSISAIIIRGFNEDIIPELLEIAKSYPNTVRYVHFRTAGRVGRWEEKFGKPYSAPELMDVLRTYVGDDAINTPHRVIRDGRHPTNSNGQALAESEQGYPARICRGCCNEFWLTPNLQVGVIEFASENSSMCWRRGKLMNDFTLQPFFENVRLFSDQVQGLTSNE